MHGEWDLQKTGMSLVCPFPLMVGVCVCIADGRPSGSSGHTR